MFSYLSSTEWDNQYIQFKLERYKNKFHTNKIWLLNISGVSEIHKTLLLLVLGGNVRHDDRLLAVHMAVRLSSIND